MKIVDFDEPTSFLDHVYLGCTNETIIEQNTKMFESRISEGATVKLPGGRNLTHKRWRGLTTWKDMLKNVLNDTVNWLTSKWSNLRSHILVRITISSNRRNLNQSENSQKFAHKLLKTKACMWHEVGNLTSHGP